MAIKIGITGGIGSGKSVVSELLRIMGIPVYISDKESKKLTASHPSIRKELISVLGEEVFSNGQLNKTLLASYLFSDPENAIVINNIIHPRVKEDFREWAARYDNIPVIAMESAILIEAGFRQEVDRLITVYAPLELRIRRAVKRDHSTRELILERIRNQMDDEIKKAQSDWVIFNDGKSAIIPQVELLIDCLKNKSNPQE